MRKKYKVSCILSMLFAACVLSGCKEKDEVKNPQIIVDYDNVNFTQEVRETIPEEIYETEYLPGYGWNLLDCIEVRKDYSVELNTGNMVEREGYAAAWMLAVDSSSVFLVHTPVDEITISCYDSSLQFIDSMSLWAPDGDFFNLPANCNYISVSQSLEGMKQSLLVQENMNGYNIFFAAQTEEVKQSVVAAVNSIEDKGVIIVLPGTYKGSVGAWGKDVTIYGVDRERCILENNSGKYHSPPLEISCGEIVNVTIRAKGTPDTTTPGAYAVHVEDHALADKRLYFENCTIYSDYNSGVGIGLRGGCDVKFVNCSLTGKDDGLFCHDSAYKQYTGVQNISFIDCEITGLTGNNALHFDSQGVEGATVNVLFVNNVLSNTKNPTSNKLLYTRNNGGKGNDTNWMGLKNYYIDPQSTGNNVESLNY